MRLPPKACIYWENIAPFLLFKDLSALEASIDNHMLRKSLYLEDINDHSDTVVHQYPYEHLAHFNVSHKIVLSSEDMRLWCEKRHLIIYDVHLKYNLPHYNVAENRSWNLLSYIKRLKVLDKKSSSYHIDYRHFSIMDSLSLSSYCNVDPRGNNLWHNRFDTLLHEKPRIGDAIPCRYCSNLQSLSFNKVVGQIISMEEFRKLISYTPMIHTFISNDDMITDTHIRFMAQYWPKLSSLSLKINNFNGEDPFDFTPFRASGHQFHTICYDTPSPVIALSGIATLVHHSQTTLRKLDVDIGTDTDIIDDDVINIITQYHHLAYLSFFNFNSKLTNRFFVAIADNLPMLEELHIYCQLRIDDSCIEAIAKKCHHLHTISLQESQPFDDCNNMLTRESYEILAKTYNKQLNSVSFGNLAAGMTSQAINEILQCTKR